MSYIKYDRGMAEAFQESLNTQVDNINIVLDNIEAFCNKSVNKIDYDTQICVEHVSSHTRVDADGNEEVISNVSYSPDYRTEWAEFIRCTDSVKKDCSSIKNVTLKKLTKIVEAIKSINLLISEFDRGENFTLVDAFSDNKNIKVVVDEETKEELIFFVDEDGNEISMSELLNSMYTYTGITMDAMVEAAIKAEEDGYDFSLGMQNAILNNVNSLVGEVKSSGILSVVSEEDILAVDAKLSGEETYESILTKSNGDGTLTGSVSSNGTNVGKEAIKAYVLSDIPENPEDYKYAKVIYSQLDEVIEGEGTVDVDIPQSDGMPSDAPSEEGVHPNGDAGNTEKDPGEPNVSDGGYKEGYTSPSDYRFDVKPEDFGKPSKIEDIKAEIHDNYDDLARDKFESLGEEVIAERRQEIISKADELYRMEDKTQLREQLSKYGYEADEIEMIIKDPNATVSAMVEGDQRSQMAEYAKEFADADGIKDFDTIYDNGQSYEDYKNGNSSSLLANMSQDANVQKAKEDYLENRIVYKTIGEDVSASVENINDALSRIEEIKANNSSSYSDWSQDTIDDYNMAVKQYNESMDDYTKQIERFKAAEAKYEMSYENYNQAKEAFIKQYNPNYELPSNNNVDIHVESGVYKSEAISGVVIGPDGKQIVKGVSENSGVSPLYSDVPQNGDGIQTGISTSYSSKPLIQDSLKDSRFSVTMPEKGSALNPGDKNEIPLPTPVTPKMEIETDAGSGSNDYDSVGKIMNSSYNEDVPIISDEEFINLPGGIIMNETGESETIDLNAGQPILINPEIKHVFVGTDEPSIPELIQPEIKSKQMQSGFVGRPKMEQK